MSNNHSSNFKYNKIPRFYFVSFFHVLSNIKRKLMKNLHQNIMNSLELLFSNFENASHKKTSGLWSFNTIWITHNKQVPLKLLELLHSLLDCKIIIMRMKILQKSFKLNDKFFFNENTKTQIPLLNFKHISQLLLSQLALRDISKKKLPRLEFHPPT